LLIQEALANRKESTQASPGPDYSSSLILSTSGSPGNENNANQLISEGFVGHLRISSRNKKPRVVTIDSDSDDDHCTDHDPDHAAPFAKAAMTLDLLC